MQRLFPSRFFIGSLLLSGLLVLAGCAVGPAYEPPQAASPARFKEAPGPAVRGEAGTWKAAQPSDALPRGQWWRIYGDAALDRLETQAMANNQDLAAAAARVAQARAMAGQARAERYPEVSAGVGATRQQMSPASQSLPSDVSVPRQTLWRVQTGVSYEVDLFGRVSGMINAAEARADQSVALLHAVQLALAADVAQSYFTIRGLDAEYVVYARAVELRTQALELAEQRYRSGEVSELDHARARADLAGTQADAMAIQRDRAAAEHRLAILLGKAPADFALPTQPLAQVTVHIPAGLPSALLERRPDIAAAERAMAAANAEIGLAKAAFFPSLSLTASGGFESGTLGNIFNWSSRTFLLGPLVGTALNLPIFDGGRRSAQLERARNAYEEQVADYRQTVLQAFREVEDGLSDLRTLGAQLRRQSEAVEAAGRAAEIAGIQYREGAVSYLEVLDAERTVLQGRRSHAQLVTAQAVASVRLIRALGGGWGETLAGGDSLAFR